MTPRKMREGAAELRGREELDQRVCRRLRRLFGEIVPAVEWKAAHVARPFAPGRERALGLGRDAAGGAPDRQQRAGDLLAGGARRLVVGEVGGAAGAIVLAGGVDAHGIVEEGVVVRERTRIERGKARALG